MDESRNGVMQCYNTPTDVIKKLHDICNWNEIDNIAIEYHDLQGTIVLITYRELFTTKTMLSDCLKCIENFEFIGINFDIPEYCVVSLMLGILVSKHGFVNIPLDLTEYVNLKNTLHISYVFCKQISIEGDIIKQFKIHGESIYLIRLNNVQKEVKRNVTLDYYAYAISTSGSTGTPKIVRVPHSCIIPNILDLNKILALKKSNKIAQFTNFTFDPSIIEIFLALSTAGTLFMVSKSLKNNASRLLEEAHSSQINLLQMTPSVFLYSWPVERLKNTILGNNSSLKVLLLGGEPLPKIESLLEVKHPHNHTKIYNVYGITEMSCWASINEIVTTNLQLNTHYLGQTLSKTIFQVRDEKGDVVTNGTGLLHIGSNSRICVINDENIEDLKLPVFRDTGDIVNIDESGKILYKGRKNNVIKRFGNKVDLTKLEEFTLQVNFVKSCYILWDESYHKLHLWLTTKKTVTGLPNLNSIMIEHLHKLPPLYRPDEIHFLEHFQLTSNGKVSVKFLKEHIQEQMTNKGVDIIDFQKTEDVFKRIWRDNLISRSGRFIDLGGTSIIALQVSNTTHQIINVEFPDLIGMLLNNSSIDECLNYIKNTILSNHRDKLINDFKCQSKEDHIIPITKENAMSSECSYAGENPDSDSVQTNSYLWHKCKGQICSNATITKQSPKLQVNTISRIEILKSYDLQKCVDASPTIFRYSNGRTYGTIGSHSGFISTFQLEENNYAPMFRIKLPDRIEASVLILDDFEGIVGCYDGNVYCLHLKTGRVIWKYQTGDVVKCSAISCEGRKKIFVGSYDCHVYCLSAKDGAEIWKIKISSGGISASGCLHSPSNSILFGTLDGCCLALEQMSGKVVWKHKFTNPIFVAPLRLNAGLVLFCSVTGMLCCFDIEVNVEMWRYRINGSVFSYIVKETDALTGCENVILASQNKNVYCLQSADPSFKTEPTLKYVLNLHSPIFATPWYEDNILYIACTDGTLYIHNFVNNRLTKTEKLPGEIFSSPVVNNDIMIIGCRDNNVYVLKLI